VTTQTILAACPVEAFRESALHVASLLPGALSKLGGIEKVVKKYQMVVKKYQIRYDNHAPQKKERHSCNPAWSPLSTRNNSSSGLLDGPQRPGLTIDLGAGTTGTRFVDCVLSTSSDLKCGHHILALKGGWTEEITRAADEYDYVSDSPVPLLIVPLLLSHPGSLNAGVLLSLRDPFTWMESRLDQHASDHCCSIPTAPCGQPLHMRTVRGKMNRPAVADAQRYEYAMQFFIYQAWAACLGSSPQLGYSTSNLFAFNLFEQLPANLQGELHAAIDRFVPHRRHPSAPTKDAFDQAWAKCSHKSSLKSNATKTNQEQTQRTKRGEEGLRVNRTSASTTDATATPPPMAPTPSRMGGGLFNFASQCTSSDSLTADEKEFAVVLRTIARGKHDSVTKEAANVAFMNYLNLGDHASWKQIPSENYSLALSDMKEDLDL